jgi:hypothetical protein
LLRGKALHVEADRSLKLGPDDQDTYLFGLPEWYVPLSVEGTGSGPFMFQANSNEHFAADLNDRRLEFDFPIDTLTTDEVVDEFRRQLKTVLPPDEYEVSNQDGHVYLESSETLSFEDHGTSTASQLLGFPEGQVPPSLTGHILPDSIPDQVDFRIEADGAVHQFPVEAGDRSYEDIASDLDDNVTSATISLVDGGDYKVDPETGRVTFLRSFSSGDQVYANYRYPVESKEHIPIEKRHSNNEAIPGCVLAFGDNLQKGDKVAVVVYPNRTESAFAYGGKFDLSIDMQIMCQDAATREDLADQVILELWVRKKSKLADEGIVIEDVSYGGESEEMYDEQAQIRWYLADISITIQADWEAHVPKPLYIKSTSQVSFEEEALAAQEGREPKPDLVRPRTEPKPESEWYEDEREGIRSRIY